MDSDEDWNSSRPSSAASEAMYFGALLDVDMRRPHDHGDVDMRLSGYGFPQVREVENEEQGMSSISNGCSKSQAMELDEVELRLVAQQQQQKLCRPIPAAYGDLTADPDVVRFDQRRKNKTKARRREARRTPDIRTPIPDVDLRELLDRRRALEKRAGEVLVTVCTVEAPAEEVGIPVEVSIEDEEDQCPVSSSQGRETPLPPRRRRSSSSSVEELPVVKRKVDIIDLSSDSEPDDPSSRDRSSAAAPPPAAPAAVASPSAAAAAAAPPPATAAAPPPATAAAPPRAAPAAAAPAESALAPGYWRPWGAVAEPKPQPSSAPKRERSPAPRGSLVPTPTLPTPTLPRPALLPTPRVFRAGAWGECRCSGTCRCGWLHGAGCLECPELQSPSSASSSSNIDVRISSRADDQGKQRATLQRAQAYSHAWSYGAAVHFAHYS